MDFVDLRLVMQCGKVDEQLPVFRGLALNLTSDLIYEKRFRVHKKPPNCSSPGLTKVNKNPAAPQIPITGITPTL